jgi:hypothetical protein
MCSGLENKQILQAKKGLGLAEDEDWSMLIACY